MTLSTTTEADDLSNELRQEALKVKESEPELAILLNRTVLAPGVVTFEDAVAATVCYRLLLHPCKTTSGETTAPLLQAMFCPNSLRKLIRESMDNATLELGHTMAYAIREDALAVCRRDPAFDSVLQVVLFSKGYAALVCHRAAYRLWTTRKYTALFLQSQASAVFGLDLHPSCQIGAKIMFDHGTGVVIGETATVGDGCTLLHGVTLGGTGKDSGDRHPKVGESVLIGANSSLLGNITIGDGCKIGAGSVVLRPIPPHATAVGVPAKIIGHAAESKPGSDIDETLENVRLLHKSSISSSASTVSMTDESTSSDDAFITATTGGVICPFRRYDELSKLAPPGSVTICTLRKLLLPLDCTANEIGACFFALDVRNVGHVSLATFRKRGADVLVQNTRLEETTVEQVLARYFESSGA